MIDETKKNIGRSFFPLVPISVLLVLLVVFGQVMSLLEIGSPVEELLQSNGVAKEYFWRLLWASLFMIILLFSGAMCWHAIRVIQNNLGDLKDNARRGLSWAIVGVILIVVLSLVCSDSTFGAVQLLIDRAGNEPMRWAVDVQFAISTATVLLVTFASCTIAYTSGEIDIQRIKRKNREFKRSFYLTSGYLGLGVVQFFSLFTWASVAAGGGDSHAVLIYAITVGSSILYTLVFVVMFVPVAIRIRAWTERIADENGIDVYNMEKLNDFRKVNGLYDSPTNTLKQLIVLISPVLVGVLSSVIG